MIWLIFVLIGIASIITSFYSSLWCWLIIVLPELYLVFEYWTVKQKKYKPFNGLSEEANLLFQEYSYYFLHQFASRDFGGSAVIMAYTGAIIGIVNIFYGFYYGIGLTIVNWFLMSNISNRINPYNNLWNDYERELSKEIFDFINIKMKEQIFQKKQPL